jgi:hypothetical protein
MPRSKQIKYDDDIKVSVSLKTDKKTKCKDKCIDHDDIDQELMLFDSKTGCLAYDHNKPKPNTK